MQHLLIDRYIEKHQQWNYDIIVTHITAIVDNMIDILYMFRSQCKSIYKPYVSNMIKFSFQRE